MSSSGTEDRDEIYNRRLYTESRIFSLKQMLAKTEIIVRRRACVYVTGSFGRAEAGQHSDLDLFIIGKNATGKRVNGFRPSQLSHLDELCVFSDLIRASKSLNIPDFDGDGRYLVHRSVDEFTKTLGMPEDDLNNTFTARLLLLLESQPLLGASAYDSVIRQVIDAYWGDFEGHENEFSPAFLANDILRLWRTLCVNYEVRTARQPQDKKIKRNIKNFKLKHSRLLTCYSALMYLLAIHSQKGTVSREDAFRMSKLSPIGRLEWLSRSDAVAEKGRATILELLIRYNKYMKISGIGDRALELEFADDLKRKQYMKESYIFGDTVFAALEQIGNGSPFHRLLVV